jgi:NAD(P) transhydrogenase subunit alpha
MAEGKTVLIGVPKETFPGETRVGLIPAVIPVLARSGADVVVEAGAGLAAGFTDEEFKSKGAKLVSRDDVFRSAHIIVQVRTYGANPEAGKADLPRFRKGQIVLGFAEPLTEGEKNRELGQTGALLFALELLPRITRAQSMDVLSSMATIAGYKAVLMAANELPRMFPMSMTAAGTLAPARAFVIGAGVAGLQAIATARRMGAVVEAYDVRPAVKEQVESLGAKFVEMELDAGAAEDKGGYAKELGEEFYRKQRELMTRVVAGNDVVISTAAIPGKKAPILITEDMLKGMHPGSVIIDLAAERGGNCDVTRPGETVVAHGVTVIGPLNMGTSIPYHASQMYARNATTFIQNLVKKGEINVNMEDEIIADTLITRDGDVVNARVRAVLGLATA